MKKLNVAIIGQGRSGRDIHGKYFLTEAGRERYNVVAISDKIEARRNRAKEEYDNCDVYEDYRELLQRKDVDAYTKLFRLTFNLASGNKGRCFWEIWASSNPLKKVKFDIL